MPSPALLPSAAILASASPDRVQTDVDFSSWHHPFVHGAPRRAPSLDSSPAGLIYRPASVDLARSTSVPATASPGPLRQSPRLASRPCLVNLSPSRLPRLSPSSSRVPSSLAATNRCISRDYPSRLWSPRARFGNDPAPGPVPSKPLHGVRPTATCLEDGASSSGAFPSATSVPPAGPVSPLCLGAGATPSPAPSAPASASTVVSPQGGSDTVELLRQQLSFLVRAWMADRSSSQQTDEVLRHVHVAVGSGREHRTGYQAAMERQIRSLRAQVHRLQQENAALKAAAAQGSKGDGGASGACALTGFSYLSDPDDAAPASLSSNPSQQSGSSRTYIFSPPPGLDGAPRRIHFATPGSSRTSPSGAPAASHVTPLDPRSQPQHAAAVDFMDPLAQNGKMPAPVIDVREIDPRLEGIPIRANAVQRSTFTSSTPPTSTAVFARKSGSAASRRARHLTPTRNLSMDRAKFWRLRRTSSKDQTMQVLAAEESRRLTTHAGHTPNHSLSLLPTMTTTGGDSTDGDNTRATRSAEARSVCIGDDGLDPEGSERQRARERNTETDNDALADMENPLGEHGLELAEDRMLQGPLMVKNIPAQDDLFFAKLDRKLECVRSGQDALPSVLRETSPERQLECGSPGLTAQLRQPVPAPPLGGDASHDTGSARESLDGESGEKDVEPEIPFRMRKTINFGAPFDSVRAKHT